MTKSILIVDDSLVVRTTLKIYIAEWGLEVCGEASDGLDAIEKTKELSPDLIVMDLSMPRMNGLQAAQKIKEERADLPIVLFTSYASVLKDSDAKSLGIDAIVCKSDGAELLKSQIYLMLTAAAR